MKLKYIGVDFIVHLVVFTILFLVFFPPIINNTTMLVQDVLAFSIILLAAEIIVDLIRELRKKRR